MLIRYTGHAFTGILVIIIIITIDHGQYVGAVFLDLANAFDCVDHATRILLNKLSSYGISDGFHSWLESFV